VRPDARRHHVRAILDVEITNCCNAHCVMCPRERTPARGFMARATFERVVERACEYGAVESFALGGLGEPLLHAEILDFVAQAAEAGLKPAIITNASLLTPELGQRLADAGLAHLNVSLGGFRKDTYEQVHRGLQFGITYRNLLTFLALPRRRTSVSIQISPTEASVREAEEIARFWRAAGVDFCFMFPQAANRGGALEGNGSLSDSALARQEHWPRGVLNIEMIFRPRRHDYRLIHRRAVFPCAAKDRGTFISWQGNYHSCSNDYEKRFPLGSVVEMSLEEAYERKAALGPGNFVPCARCNLRGTDVPPRSPRFYWTLAWHLLGSHMARLRGTHPHPDLPTAESEREGYPSGSPSLFTNRLNVSTNDVTSADADTGPARREPATIGQSSRAQE